MHQDLFTYTDSWGKKFQMTSYQWLKSLISSMGQVPKKSDKNRKISESIIITEVHFEI